MLQKYFTSVVFLTQTILKLCSSNGRPFYLVNELYNGRSSINPQMLWKTHNLETGSLALNALVFLSRAEGFLLAEHNYPTALLMQLSEIGPKFLFLGESPLMVLLCSG